MGDGDGGRVGNGGQEVDMVRVGGGWGDCGQMDMVRVGGGWGDCGQMDMVRVGGGWGIVDRWTW